MSRKVFDQLTSAGGVVVVVVLLVAGGLLLWGHSFVNSNVHNQLARQEIVFPPKAAFAHAKAGTEITPAMIPSVSKYAGQELLTGPQAQAYADHFIAIHLSELPFGGVYSKISAAAIASPEQHQTGGSEAGFLPGHDATRPAARGLRLLEDRSDHAVGRDRLVRRGSHDAGTRRPWLPARSQHRTRKGDARAEAEAEGDSGLLIRIVSATLPVVPRRPRSA